MKKQEVDDKQPLKNDFDSLKQGIDDSLIKLIQRSEQDSIAQTVPTRHTEERRSSQPITQQQEKPTETLNTRIPKSLDDAIAEWIYQSRKQGQPITKQQLAIDALTHYLNTKMND